MGNMNNSNYVSVLSASMGWGKTTHFMFRLAAAVGETVYITLPSIALVHQIYQSLQDAKAVNKGDNVFDSMTVGRNVEGIRDPGNIVVQTPYYLRIGDLNVIDEFQFITHHNI